MKPMIERWDDLRFLLALARERTLTAAATALGVSQPTLGPRADHAASNHLGRRRPGASFAATGRRSRRRRRGGERISGSVPMGTAFAEPTGTVSCPAEVESVRLAHCLPA